MDDSPIHLKCMAFRIAAAYVNSGICKELSSLGRVYKALVENLRSKDQCLGCADGSSPQGQTLLQLSLLNGWAEIQNCLNPAAPSKNAMRTYMRLNFNRLADTGRYWLLFGYQFCVTLAKRLTNAIPQN